MEGEIVFSWIYFWRQKWNLLPMSVALHQVNVIFILCYFGMFRHTWWSNSQQCKLIGSLKVKDPEHTATGTQKYHYKPRFFLFSCTIILIMWNFQSSYLFPYIGRMAAAVPAIKSILRKESKGVCHPVLLWHLFLLWHKGFHRNASNRPLFMTHCPKQSQNVLFKFDFSTGVCQRY